MEMITTGYLSDTHTVSSYINY